MTFHWRGKKNKNDLPPFRKCRLFVDLKSTHVKMYFQQGRRVSIGGCIAAATCWEISSQIGSDTQRVLAFLSYSLRRPMFRFRT